MDFEIRQAEREGNLSRVGLLRCRAGEHFWNSWHDKGPKWPAKALYELLGKAYSNIGIREGQTCSYQQSRECFWCDKQQRHFYIMRWSKDIMKAERVAEFTHEL